MTAPFTISHKLPLAGHRGLGALGLLSPAIYAKHHTAYEELLCVGYHPELEELYAVVALKQPGGYGGDVCAAGTVEYVRFYISYDDRATWRDVGVTAAVAHDLGDAAPVNTAVTLRVDAPAFPCSDEKANVAHVRAILSWGVEPPANAPGFSPSWGNVLEAEVQLDPIAPRAPALGQPFDMAAFGPAGDVAQVLKPKAGASLALLAQRGRRPMPAVRQLLKKYLAAGVPAHRALLPFLDVPAGVTASAPMPPSVLEAIQAEKLQLEDIVKAFVLPAGDTTFEELACVGLDALRKQLVAVVHVKRPSGYSGSLCQAGSREHVAFWVDWGTGSWAYQGTADVTVHDIASMGAGGLRYAVSLPISLRERQLACAAGPNVVKVRAVLSWRTAPSTTNPDYVPRWGNRRETEVVIPARRGDAALLGQFQAAGRIALDDIGPDGFTRSTAAKPTVVTVSGPGNSYREAPFGGMVTLHGEVYAPPGTRYRFHIRELDPVTWSPRTAFTPLVANYPTGATVYQRVGTAAVPVELRSDAAGWYVALPNIWEDILAIWYTNESQSGRLYELFLEIEGEVPPPMGRPMHRLYIDNTVPTATLTLDNPLSGDCWDKPHGEPITGGLVARADYFETMQFRVLPPNPSGFIGGDPSAAMTVARPTLGGAPVEPAHWSYPAIATQEGLPQGIPLGAFSLDTTPMLPCGYSLTLTVWSRTNVNSGGTKRAASDHVGFCVKPPAP